mgnify:FL=1
MLDIQLLILNRKEKKMNDVDIIMYVLSFFIGLLFMFLSFTINVKNIGIILFLLWLIINYFINFRDNY